MGGGDGRDGAVKISSFSPPHVFCASTTQQIDVSYSLDIGIRFTNSIRDLPSSEYTKSKKSCTS